MFSCKIEAGPGLVITACSYSGFLCLKVLGLWIIQTNLILFAGLTTCPAS